MTHHIPPKPGTAAYEIAFTPYTIPLIDWSQRNISQHQINKNNVSRLTSIVIINGVFHPGNYKFRIEQKSYTEYTGKHVNYRLYIGKKDYIVMDLTFFPKKLHMYNQHTIINRLKLHAESILRGYFKAGKYNAFLAAQSGWHEYAQEEELAPNDFSLECEEMKNLVFLLASKERVTAYKGSTSIRALRLAWLYHNGFVSKKICTDVVAYLPINSTRKLANDLLNGDAVIPADLPEEEEQDDSALNQDQIDVLKRFNKSDSIVLKDAEYNEPIMDVLMVLLKHGLVIKTDCANMIIFRRTIQGDSYLNHLKNLDDSLNPNNKKPATKKVTKKPGKK